MATIADCGLILCPVGVAHGFTRDRDAFKSSAASLSCSVREVGSPVVEVVVSSDAERSCVPGTGGSLPVPLQQGTSVEDSLQRD